jgi:hypothetical protein
MSSTRPRKFWRIYRADGTSYLARDLPLLEEGETASRVGLDGITWREYATMLDDAAQDSHHAGLAGVHEWLARRIIRATSAEDRFEGEVIAQKVLRSIYEEYGGLHEG